eukprot:3940840-Rhodomonas_salina.1
MMMITGPGHHDSNHLQVRLSSAAASACRCTVTDAVTAAGTSPVVVVAALAHCLPGAPLAGASTCTFGRDIPAGTN